MPFILILIFSSNNLLNSKSDILKQILLILDLFIDNNIFDGLRSLCNIFFSFISFKHLFNSNNTSLISSIDKLSFLSFIYSSSDI